MFANMLRSAGLAREPKPAPPIALFELREAAMRTKMEEMQSVLDAADADLASQTPKQPSAMIGEVLHSLERLAAMVSNIVQMYGLHAKSMQVDRSADKREWDISETLAAFANHVYDLIFEAFDLGYYDYTQAYELVYKEFSDALQYHHNANRNARDMSSAERMEIWRDAQFWDDVLFMIMRVKEVCDFAVKVSRGETTRFVPVTERPSVSLPKDLTIKVDGEDVTLFSRGEQVLISKPE